MNVDGYVRLSDDYRVARGRVKFFRDMCEELFLALESDLEGAQITLIGEQEPAEQPTEDADEAGAPFRVDLGAWMTGQEISGGISDFRRIRAALKEAWASLSESERRALKSPDEM
jgi:hypothetical protein